jgi:hypothetical protein
MQTLRTMEMKGQVIRLLNFSEGRLVEVVKHSPNSSLCACQFCIGHYGKCH